MSKAYAKSHDVYDMYVQVPKLAWLVMRTESGSATLSGYFTDIEGRIIGNVSYTGSIDTTPRTLGNASSGARVLTGLTAIPANAVGFKGRCSAGFVYAYGADDDSTIPTALADDMNNNTSQYPFRDVTTDNDFTLGRAS